MTHLALRLTARSEARITRRHALRRGQKHDSSCFTSNNEVRSKDYTASCFTSNNEVRSMTHLALRLTTRSEARNTSTPPFREGPFGQYQAYLESVQTLHEIEA
jgi:hypothetical protein